MKLKRIIIILMVSIMLPLVSKAFEINLSIDKENIKKNDEIVLRVKTNEKVIATNFEIDYNNKVFKFIEGVNINAAEKDGKIACIYGDLTGKGEDEFLIKFKAIKSSKNSEFKIENKKFRSINKEESYTDENIIGKNSLSLEVEKNKKDILILIVLIILILVFIIIICCKYKKCKINTNFCR